MTRSDDEATIIITPLKFRDKFPERYVVVCENGEWYIKQLMAEPIPIGYRIPKDFHLVSNNRRQIIFSNGRAPKPKKRRKYRRS